MYLQRLEPRPPARQALHPCDETKGQRLVAVHIDECVDPGGVHGTKRVVNLG